MSTGKKARRERGRCSVMVSTSRESVSLRVFGHWRLERAFRSKCGNAGSESRHSLSFSRGISASEACSIPLAQGEGAERRQALGCLRGTPSRADDASPQALRGASRLSGDARLSALHRGGCWPGPAQRDARKASPSAPSGAGRGSGASRELRARQRAGRHILSCPCDASRRAPFGERDAVTLDGASNPSNESDGYAKRTVSKLSMKQRERCHKRCRIRATCIHRNVV